MKRKALLLLLACGGTLLVIHIGNDAMRLLQGSAPSQSFGTHEQGRLVRGKRLPSAGENFQTYTRLGSLLGRTCVHSQVRAAMLESYRSLAESVPSLHYTYGETGWCSGGRIRPHKTHRNGLSVDFMVPVRRRGEPTRYPSRLTNRFGYNVEFDSTGRARELEIDFEAMALHLHALHEAATMHGLGIEVVIFDSDLQKALFATGQGGRLREKMRFSKLPAWVRHDEHYHVNFTHRS